MASQPQYVMQQPVVAAQQFVTAPQVVAAQPTVVAPTYVAASTPTFIAAQPQISYVAAQPAYGGYSKFDKFAGKGL